jgi:leucyl/phenylalanyl-tRNA--protein transferase
MSEVHPVLPWIEPGCALPTSDQAWPANSSAPGLLAAGADLSVSSLTRAYGQGAFPWFNNDQPILWWSPDPRMVMQTRNFKISPSFKKSLKKFIHDSACTLRIDYAFSDVIRCCAQTPRRKQSGTWIVPDMVDAYIRLHQAGYAHSVETWVNNELVGGLYCVALGKAVFGESMFSLRSDASKIALAGLVALCHAQGISHIDCQQNTAHLASLGASELSRSTFIEHIEQAQQQSGVSWQFDSRYWQLLL